MKLIVGLGNPGQEYENTRHNIGFMVLDTYLGKVKWKSKNNAFYYETNINGEKYLFLKPLTFMNLSGNAVKKYVDYYNIALEDILIIHDDLDLKLGTIRLKQDSSAGGHNGIKSIIQCLSTQNFKRLKIGISSVQNGDTIDYVLGKFSKTEINELNNILDICYNIIEDFSVLSFDELMSKYNKRGKV